jgi:hypothetical protein
MQHMWPIPDPAVIAQTIRESKVITFEDVSQDVVDYAAGLVDADGKVQTDIISVSQAQKGVACLHFMYDNFGGQVVALPHKDEENHQQSYEWQVFSNTRRAFARCIVNSLLLKKREAIAMIEYETLPKLAKKQARDDLKKLKHIEHDPISEEINPTDAYFAGFSDGEITLDVHGKNSQHHTISQSYRPICDAFERRFGGTIRWSIPPNSVFVWTIYTFADKFLKTIAPYIVGKKAQVDLILGMKIGQAADIHCALRELKGNIGPGLTPKIDRHLAGNGRVYVNPPKELPMGVHPSHNGKFIALMKRGKEQYSLGSFDTVEAALAQYEKYKYLVEAEKRGGPKVDLAFNTVESKRNPPPPVGQVLPKGIYLTKSNTYQVRGRDGTKKPVQLGTHKTLEAAQAAYKAHVDATGIV